MEVVVTHRVTGCREALGKLSLENIVEALRGLFDVERITFRGRGQAEVVFVYRPDEFTKKRLKTRIREAKRGPGELEVEVRGKAEVDLLVKCNDGEAVVVIGVHGKTEKMVSRDKVEEVANRILEALERLAPQQPAAPRAAPAAPVTPPPARPAAAAAPATPAMPPAAPPQPAAAGGGLDERALAECMIRLFTAGFPVSGELSRRIPVEYSPRLRWLPYVDGGRARSENLNLLRYDDGYMIRLVSGDVTVDIVRAGGQVGIYYRGPEGESFGEAAARIAAEKLCKPGTPITYTVVRLS